MNISHRLIVISMFLMAIAVSADASPQFLKVSDKRTVGFMQLMADIDDSDVIIIGETHDVKKQHENQLDIIRALYAKKSPVTIGLEMFTSDNQRQLDDWIGGKIDEKGFEAIYSRNWSYDWLLYRDIFIFARDNHIPMIALNIPKNVVSKVMQHGFASLGPSDKKDLPPDVTCVLGTSYTEFLKKVYTQHVNNTQAFTYFCEAQALYNNGMAWNILEYRKKHPKNKIVVITGALHAIKVGVPDQLKQHGTISYKVILPALPDFNLKNATSDDADYFMLK